MDRSDLPFVAVPDPTSQADTPTRLSDRRTDPAASFARHWDGMWWAWGAMAEFTATGEWQAFVAAQPAGPLTLPTWQELLAANEAPEPRSVEEEIELLIRAAEDERPEALGEILAQAANFFPDMMGVMSISTASHPRTVRLMEIGNLVATLAAMRHKRLSERARPSQVCPALRPTVPMPGHSSYPSGHATQVNLVALVAGSVVGETRAAAALAMAQRIARNREIAGVHYRSDTQAGEMLARKLFEVLSRPGACPSYDETLAAARREWS